MVAYTDIPQGWVAFDSLSTLDQLETKYPILYRKLINQFGTKASIPTIQDHYVRNQSGSLRVGQLQNAQLGRHVHKMVSNQSECTTDTFTWNDFEKDGFSDAPTSRHTTFYDSILTDNKWMEPKLTSNYATGGNETRPKTIVMKLCIKASNSINTTPWIKAVNGVTNNALMDSSTLSQDIQGIKSTVGVIDETSKQQFANINSQLTLIKEAIKERTEPKVLWSGTYDGVVNSRNTTISIGKRIKANTPLTFEFHSPSRTDYTANPTTDTVFITDHDVATYRLKSFNYDWYSFVTVDRVNGTVKFERWGGINLVRIIGFEDNWRDL